MSNTPPPHNFIPDENHRFYESKATLIANDILECELKGKVDEKWVNSWAESGGKFEALSKDIADKIKDKCIATLNIPRFKIFVQVTIGQKKDQGVTITSRCLWDTVNDNYATAHFQNQHVWASAIVFALHTD